MFGEMVSVGPFEVTDEPRQNYTFLVESGRSGTFWLQLVANLPTSAYFLGSFGQPPICLALQKYRDLPVVVNSDENDFSFDPICQVDGS